MPRSPCRRCAVLQQENLHLHKEPTLLLERTLGCVQWESLVYVWLLLVLELLRVATLVMVVVVVR